MIIWIFAFIIFYYITRSDEPIFKWFGWFGILITGLMVPLIVSNVAVQYLILGIAVVVSMFNIYEISTNFKGI